MKPINTLIFAFVLFLPSGNLFAVTATDLNCTSCVQTLEIQDNAIKTGKINNSAVTSIKISDGTITNSDISSTAAIDASKISGTAWTSTNDGSGSSLEADLLDGLDSSQFLQTDGTGGLSLLSGALTIDNSWNTNPTYDGTTYTNRATLATTPGSNNNISIHTEGGPRTALVTDGPFISTESGAYFYGSVGIGTSSPDALLDVDGDMSVLSGALTFDNSWNPNPSYGGTTYTTRATLQTTSGSNNSIAIHTTGGSRTALVTDGPFISTESGAYFYGSVGIGTTSPSYKLDISGGTGTALRIAGGGDLQIDAQVSGDDSVFYNDYGTLNLTTGLNVDGTLQTRELIVTESSWSDFVFKDDYQLKSLAELESFIQQNKHLPDIPSEKEVLANGVSVGDMQKRLLQKVEELTLYVIAQDKKIAEQDKQITELERGGNE